MTARTVLVGDIGGTNVRFSVAHITDGKAIRISDFKKWRGRDFPTLIEAVRHFMSQLDAVPDHISLAVAGPVTQGAVTLTNRAWSISETQLFDMLGFKQAKLWNDFAAMARCIPEMDADDFDPIHVGAPQGDHPVLVAGPGTGFGAAFLVPMGQGWHVVSSEAGRMAYAPRTAQEMQIRSILSDIIQSDTPDFVSVEAVASGSGMAKLHEAVCIYRDVPYAPLTPDALIDKARAGDPVCEEICTLRACAAMGAIGDMALAGGARGGIVLAGGVTGHMIEFFRRPEPMARLHKRGPRTDYMQAMPMRFLKNSTGPLIGAAALYADFRQSNEA